MKYKTSTSSESGRTDKTSTSSKTGAARIKHLLHLNRGRTDKQLHHVNRGRTENYKVKDWNKKEESSNIWPNEKFLEDVQKRNTN